MPAQARELLEQARSALLAQRHVHGHWVGELSSSALSTATAVFAFHLSGDTALSAAIDSGLRWLIDHQNKDGGWGDTVKSHSNLSTTALVWAVLGIPQASVFDEAPRRAEAWILLAAGSLDEKPLAYAIAARYGKDRTFSVPILTMLALAGRVSWAVVPQLPFELAALPHRFFQILKLPVVSYALPALIAIGQVRHTLRPAWNPVTRMLRGAARKRTLRKLKEIQPTTGGYLEATPLTAFVCMSLLGAKAKAPDVLASGLEFLKRSQREDGSWPIDTNLSTWVTTLSVNALTDNTLSQQQELTDWLLNQQVRTVHQYTMADPGGWAWTDLSGGVPDADDTPSALLALGKLPVCNDTIAAAEAGVNWLLNLQNSDGGMPTFCKGWTNLPFDRSSNDLTAHVLLAWEAWREKLPLELRTRIGIGTQRGMAYLLQSQQDDGAWAPLWFGNQHGVEIANLTYGTSRVLRVAHLAKSRPLPEVFRKALHKGADYLLNTQNPDGGWGGRTNTPSSIEETALAMEGLANYFLNSQRYAASTPPLILRRGVNYLMQATQGGTVFDPSPIGFYFANLWYFEKLYPVIYTVAALTQVTEVLTKLQPTDSPSAASSVS
jgi:squalene-hopene/tetraprenyl-beta-curcumene cyclase